MGEGRAALTGVDTPGREARLLLEAATGLDQAALLREPERLFDPAQYRALLARRAAHEPLAFITGFAEFWSLRLAVSRATLIPRPDTETLIEAALAARRDVASVLDLGTGTGCLLLAALSEYRGAWGLGVDRNPAAAALAHRNAVGLGLDDRAIFACGDWDDAIAGRFDLVLSNPPYIPQPDLAGLMTDVRDYEPAAALDGGADGLDAYRRIIARLPHLLATGGLAVLELGIGQAGPVAALGQEAGFQTEVRPDLAGIPRALLLAFGPEHSMSRRGREGLDCPAGDLRGRTEPPPAPSASRRPGGPV